MWEDTADDLLGALILVLSLWQSAQGCETESMAEWSKIPPRLKVSMLWQTIQSTLVTGWPSDGPAAVAPL